MQPKHTIFSICLFFFLLFNMVFISWLSDGFIVLQWVFFFPIQTSFPLLHYRDIFRFPILSLSAQTTFAPATHFSDHYGNWPHNLTCNPLSDQPPKVLSHILFHRPTCVVLLFGASRRESMSDHHFDHCLSLKT